MHCSTLFRQLPFVQRLCAVGGRPTLSMPMCATSKPGRGRQLRHCSKCCARRTRDSQLLPLRTQVHKARLRLHKPPPRRWWHRSDVQKQAEYYAALPPAAAAATQARLAEGAATDGTVAVKVGSWKLTRVWCQGGYAPWLGARAKARFALPSGCTPSVLASVSCCTYWARTSRYVHHRCSGSITSSTAARTMLVTVCWRH